MNSYNSYSILPGANDQIKDMQTIWIKFLQPLLYK